MRIPFGKSRVACFSSISTCIGVHKHYFGTSAIGHGVRRWDFIYSIPIPVAGDFFRKKMNYPTISMLSSVLSSPLVLSLNILHHWIPPQFVLHHPPKSGRQAKVSKFE